MSRTKAGGTRYVSQTARRARSGSERSCSASAYTAKPNASAARLATITTPAPAVTPGNHATARPRIGNNGKKRRPSRGTAPYPARAMSRYQAASQPDRLACTRVEGAVCSVDSTWRVTTSAPTTITRDATNGMTTARAARVGVPTSAARAGRRELLEGGMLEDVAFCGCADD